MSMDNTPGFSGKAPDGCTTRGGNYWTLIAPGTWKVLHADLHTSSPSSLQSNWKASPKAKDNGTKAFTAAAAPTPARQVRMKSVTRL